MFYLFVILVIGAMVLQATSWNGAAKIVPVVVGCLGLTFAILGLLNQVLRGTVSGSVQPSSEAEVGSARQRLHMDLGSDIWHLPPGQVLTRASIFFGWLIAFMLSMATIGLIPTVPLFVIIFMRVENREPWKMVIPQALALTAFIYIVFDRLLTITWPTTLLGDWLPAMKVIPSV